MRNLLKGCCVIAFPIVIALVIAYTQANRFWFANGDESEMQTILVESGDSFSTIAQTLEDEGIVPSAFWLRVFAKVDGSHTGIQPGEFQIPKGSSYASILEIMSSSERKEVSITIPEGYTVAQIGELVTASFNVTDEEWSLLVGAESPLEGHRFVVTAQKPDNVGLEGYLFPDTYRFFENATGEEIVTKLIDTMEKRVMEADVNLLEISALSGQDPDITTLHDYLTLASIIQREVLTRSEMKDVADIFYKRMEIGMPLQADSTVNYVTGKKTPGISLADRDLQTPYNTYQNVGLPPGAISNPGLDALIATAHPTSNEYFYFLTTSTGDVIYGVTHDEHVQNKNIYLR